MRRSTRAQIGRRRPKNRDGTVATYRVSRKPGPIQTIFIISRTRLARLPFSSPVPQTHFSVSSGCTKIIRHSISRLYEEFRAFSTEKKKKNMFFRSPRIVANRDSSRSSRVNRAVQAENKCTKPMLECFANNILCLSQMTHGRGACSCYTRGIHYRPGN